MSLLDWPILRGVNTKFLSTVRIAFVFGQTGYEALMITADDKVYGVGDNISNCLGVKSTDIVKLPSLISVLSDKNVEGFTFGGDVKDKIFVIARLRNGDIYQWGSLSMSDEEIWPTPVLVDFNVELRVKAVACGLAHCMILSDDGRVFTWGQNDEGQLGLDLAESDDDTDQIGAFNPEQVKDAILDKVVTEISCGAKFSVAILDDGKVFSWGSNIFGQLGINNADVVTTVPVAVSLPNNVVIEKIVCGYAHVLALSKNHQLYVWGNNKFLQLGVPALKKDSYYEMPVKCGGNLRFVDIGASYACNLSVAQCESGIIYVWGKTASGEIIAEPTHLWCETIHQAFAFHASPNVMPKPMRHILGAKRRMTLLKTLKSQFGNPENSDLTILVDGREIYVHQAILKMRSTYFKAMLSRWVNEDQKVVTIREKSYTIVEAYLKYLYTAELEVDLELAIELLQLGDEYADEDFKLLCEKNIRRDMTADTVAEIFALTRKLGTCQDLNEFCLQYALEHADDVVDSEGFQKWDVDTIRAFTFDYVKMKESEPASD